MVKYSREPTNKNNSARAMGCDLGTSFTNTYNVTQAIRKWKLQEAKQYLMDVLGKKRVIPGRRFSGCWGRTAQAKEFKRTQGRWPEKSVKAVLGLLKNAEANAEFKNLNSNVERGVIGPIPAMTAIRYGTLSKRFGYQSE